MCGQVLSLIRKKKPKPQMCPWAPKALLAMLLLNREHAVIIWDPRGVIVPPKMKRRRKRR